MSAKLVKRLLIWAIDLLLTLLVVVGLNAFTFATARDWTIRLSQPGAILGPDLSSSKPTRTAAPGEQAGEPVTGPLPPESLPELTPWDGTGRVTILLLGLDYRDWEARSEAARSDTMILMTLDPQSKTAGILSVPRDMWVAIPGFKHGKINTAHYLGDAYKLPGGGPGLAVKTVEQFLGVPINYYARIDFGAFVRFIDEIGGVKIDVPEPITIDLLGGGPETKKKLKAGVQVLPGEWALAYARARNTQGGDFDRAKRQQQVILAIRDRILSVDMLPILIEKSDVLYRELAAGIHTNLSLDQVIKLALLAREVPEANIRRGVIGEKQILFGRSPDDLAILIPLIDKIHVLRDEIFVAAGTLGPLTPGDAQGQMLAEGARVVVVNESGTPGLAERTRQYLQSMGMNVIEARDGEGRTSLSAIRDQSGKPFTMRYLFDQLHIAEHRVLFEEDHSLPYDVLITLGGDWARNNPMP